MTAATHRTRSALLAFMGKEVRHLLRDRQTLAILLLLPLAQVVLFGFAVRTDIHSVRLAIVTPAPDDATRALQTRFEHNGRFRIVATPPRAEALDELFRRGTAEVSVVLPTGPRPGPPGRHSDGHPGGHRCGGSELGHHDAELCQRRHPRVAVCPGSVAAESSSSRSSACASIPRWRASISLFPG